MDLPKIIDKNNNVLIYENEFAIKEKTAGKSLIATPDKDHVNVMLNLLKTENNNHSYGITYFIVGNSIYNGKKYDMVKPLTWNELEDFCKKYKDYMETDAGHNFKISDNETKNAVVYDHRNILHIYGNLEEKIKILENYGYKKVEKITLPKGYALLCHPQNADIEEELINSYEWKVTSVKIHDPQVVDDDCDKEIEKKSFFDSVFDYLETETI